MHDVEETITQETREEPDCCTDGGNMDRSAQREKAHRSGLGLAFSCGQSNEDEDEDARVEYALRDRAEQPSVGMRGTH